MVFIRRFLPDRFFVTLSSLIWLGFNSTAAWVKYKQYQGTEYAKPYLAHWLDYIPWWGHWIWITPLLVTLISLLSQAKITGRKLAVCHMLLFTLVMPIYWFFSVLSASLISQRPTDWQSLQYYWGFVQNGPFYLDLLVYFSVLCVAYVRQYKANAVEVKLRNKALAHQLVQVELDSLKSQLNPHFLFNTLNSIASLIRQENKDFALTALSELSQMLRKVLEHQNSQLIPLSQELEFINSYLTLQKIRFGDKLQIDIQCSQEAMLCELPFMLLQPLVENAVQHSSQLESDNNLIELIIIKQGSSLELYLRNPFEPDNQKSGFGIGLQNCKKRLAKIYADEFEFDHGAISANQFEIKITIPCGEDHA